MDPITIIVWLWLSWGVTSMLVRGERAAAADAAVGDPEPDTPAPPPAPPAPESAPAGDSRTFRQRVADRVRGWVGQADANADGTRTTDWGNPGWWLRVLLAAAWTPVRDIRDGGSYVRAKVRGDDDNVQDPGGGNPTPPPSGGGEDHDARRTGGQHTPPGAGAYGDESDPPDIEVEVTGTRPNTPPTAQLDRPAAALTAAAEPTPEPASTMTVEEVRTDERTDQMAAGQYVAIPGSSGLAARQGGVAATPGNGDTHEDAKDFAKKIVTAMEMTTDPCSRAEQMLEVSLKAAWAAIDRLQDAGISGPVLERWCEAVVDFGVARQTAATLVQQVEAARTSSGAASRLQAKVGDKVQTAVEAAGKSAANHTSYYGKK